MSGRRARSNRRLIKAATEVRELATDLRREAADIARGGDQEDRDTAAWLRELANQMYGGAAALPIPDTRTLERAARLAALIEQKISAMVVDLRAQGVGWQRIGYALGITADGARKRYSPTVQGETR
jgi:hypothetical protein